MAPVKSSDTVAYERKSPSAKSAISSSKRKIAFWLRSYSSCNRATRCLSITLRSVINLNTEKISPPNERIRTAPKNKVSQFFLATSDKCPRLSNITSDLEKI
ncbi:hypothetical protein AMPH_82668 [Acinetobacter baumannii]|nr:hypothetical protein AMPH_82668 [Acinetobacter baumannii]